MNNRLIYILNRIAYVVVPLGLILLVILICLLSYNNIAKSQEYIKEAKAEVENTCQRRLDLIPNLVKVVTAYAKYEKETLVAVTEARRKTEQVLGEIAKSNSTFIEKEQVKKLADVQSELNGSITSLLAVVEKYPDLKANNNFTMLQDQLEGTENRIAIARQRYNEAVRRYNSKVITFPGNVIASAFGFQKNDAYFEASERAKESLQLQL
jgi:LemA protein